MYAVFTKKGLMCVYLLISGLALMSQDLLVSYRCTECKVSGILNDLSDTYGLIFAYDNQLIGDKVSSIDLIDVPIRDALNAILFPHRLQAIELSRGQYAIEKRGVSTLQRKSEVRVIQGKVIQADTGEPLPFATIRISEQRGASTSESGDFYLLIGSPFPDSLVVTYLGFLPQKVACRYDESIVLQLTPSPTSIEDIIITDGERQTLRINDGGGDIRMDPQRLHLLSGLGESDLLRGLQLLPGLSSANERATGMYVRGGTPAENLILLDGITLYQPGHFFGLLSAINPEAMKDVRMYRSGVGARYGGRTAAVIDITGKPGRVLKPRMGASINLMNAQAFVEVPWQDDKGGLLIAARRSYTDVAPSPFFKQLFNNRFQEGAIYFYGQQSMDNEEDISVNSRLHYFDINAKWLYRPNDKDLISITAIKSGDDLTFGLQEKLGNGLDLITEDRLRLVNDGASGTFARQWNSRHYTRANIAYSGYQNRYHYSYSLDEDGSPIYRSDLRRSQFLKDVSTRIEHSWSPSKTWRSTGGIQQTLLWLDGVQSLDDSQAPISAEETMTRQVLHAAFGEVSYSSKYLGVEAGLRTNMLNNLPSLFIEPRIMAYYQPNEFWRIQANVGRYHQFLNYVSVYNGLEAGEDYWALADQDSVNTLRSDMVSLSLSCDLDQYLFQVEGYMKNMSGLMAYELRYNPNLNETDQGERLTDGQGKVAGIELMIQRKTGNYTGWIAYTYSRVLQRFPGTEEGLLVPASFDRPHQLSVVNQYIAGPWEASATFVLASGIPYTPANGVNGVQLPSGNYLYFLEFGPRNSQRLPAYHRLDLTITHRITYDKGSVKLGASIFNAYGHRNLGNRIFAVNRPANPGEEATVLTLDKPLLGFTPNIFLAWEWQ